jgi:hypothetical protein
MSTGRCIKGIRIEWLRWVKWVLARCISALFHTLDSGAYTYLYLYLYCEWEDSHVDTPSHDARIGERRYIHVNTLYLYSVPRATVALAAWRYRRRYCRLLISKVLFRYTYNQ